MAASARLRQRMAAAAEAAASGMETGGREVRMAASLWGSGGGLAVPVGHNASNCYFYLVYYDGMLHTAPGPVVACSNGVTGSGCSHAEEVEPYASSSAR